MLNGDGNENGNTFKRSSYLMRVDFHVEGDSNLLLFFLSKSPGCPEISRQKHLQLPLVSYLLQ